MDINTSIAIEPVQQEVVPVEDRSSLLDYFISCQDRKPTTLATYRNTLSRFFAWLDGRGYSLRGLTRPQIIEYKESLVSEGKSALTISSYLTSVRLFYQWLEAEGIYPNIAKVLNLPRRKQAFRKRPLERSQVENLLRKVEDSGNLRDNAILNLMVRLGLRCVEVTRLNFEDISYIGGQRIISVQGKGRDERDQTLNLNERAFRPLSDYLATRGPLRPKDPLFVSVSHRDRGQRMTTRSISRIAKNYLKEIGLSDRVFTAHSLRHTTAYSLRKLGVPTTDVQKVLRHANPATTEIYTAFAEEEEHLKKNVEGLLDDYFNF